MPFSAAARFLATRFDDYARKTVDERLAAIDIPASRQYENGNGYGERDAGLTPQEIVEKLGLEV